MRRRGNTITTPYGKKVKAKPRKAFTPKPLDPSPYIWIQLPLADMKAAYESGGAKKIRKMVLSRIKEKDAISGKYFFAALTEDFAPRMAIVRGDTRIRSLEVIGRTLSPAEEGGVLQFRPSDTPLDISSRIES